MEKEEKMSAREEAVAALERLIQIDKITDIQLDQQQQLVRLSGYLKEALELVLSTTAQLREMNERVHTLEVELAKLKSTRSPHGVGNSGGLMQ